MLNLLAIIDDIVAGALLLGCAAVLLAAVLRNT
jgi:hypothetical protein